MANNYTETEVKLYVPDLDAVRATLESLKALLKAARVLERNVRYDNIDGSLTSNGGVLRMRQDSRARLTYKDGDRVIGAFGSSRFEAEVEVSDFNAMDTILKKLGYHPYMTYEKYRTTYTLDDCEVTLDEMPYGNFVEIEGEDAKIGQVMDRLGLTRAPRAYSSYTVLFEYVRRNLNLTFTDLTFANFKGINVPFSAFLIKD